jgi:hypothetical protein
MFRTNEKLDTDNFIRVSCFDYPRIGFHLTVSPSTYSGFQTLGYLLVRVGCFQGVDCFSFQKRSRFDIENAEHDYSSSGLDSQYLCIYIWYSGTPAQSGRRN